AKGKGMRPRRRIEGQVQGIQRMVEEDKYCVDILLQLTAVQGAVEQVQKLVLGQHLETCVADAVRSGSSRDRQRKLDEMLEGFSRFSGRWEPWGEPEDVRSPAARSPGEGHALRGLRRQGRARAPVRARGDRGYRQPR